MYETWLPITIFPYSKNYAVSSLGKVKRTTKGGNRSYVGKILKQTNIYGYFHVVLYECGTNGGKRKMFRVNRLVALAFIANSENKPCVNHIDCNKLNNSVENLEWCTYQENTKHAIKNKLIPKGINHRNSRFTEKEIKEIRTLYQKGKHGRSTCSLAKKYNVAHKTIWNIVNYITWRHI